MESIIGAMGARFTAMANQRKHKKQRTQGPQGNIVKYLSISKASSDSDDDSESDECCPI